MSTSVHPEPVEGELPDFLKRGFPEGPAPREYPRPGRMAFPEMRALTEIGGHNPPEAEEVAWRAWWRNLSKNQSTKT